MKYIYSLVINLLFTLTCLAQKTEYHISLGSNLSFSSFNDKIYSYPAIPSNTGYISYSSLPNNIDRRTIPQLGLQVQGEVFYKLNHKFYLGTGLKFLVYRHAYDQEFEENPFDPYGNRWSSSLINITPSTVANTSDNIRRTRIMYLSVPLQFKFQINSKMFSYSGINGSVPLLVAQKSKSLSVNTNQTRVYQSGSEFYYPNYNISYSETNKTDKSKSAFNSIHYALQLGIGFKVSTYTSLKVDFNHGISNTYSDIRENNSIRSFMRTLNFSYDCLLDL